VALSANVDVEIVLVREYIRGCEEIIIRGGERISELVGVSQAAQQIRPDMGGVRIVTNHAGYSDMPVVLGDQISFDHGEAGRADVTTATRVGIHVLLADLGVTARNPLFVMRAVRNLVVTATANRGRDFRAGSDGGVVLIGRVVCRGAVAALALDTGQTGIGVRIILADKSSRQPEPYGVARKTGTVCLAALGHEQRIGKRASVLRVQLSRVNALMAFGTSLRAGVIRRRTGNAEEGIALNVRQRGGSRRVRSTNILPRLCREAQPSQQLIIAGRPVPSDLYPVGDPLNPRYDGHSRHATFLRNA